MNQEITFLSDGDDTLRKLQLEMSPMATHLLDWFHLTMRLTVLDQYGKGLVQCEAGLGEAVRDQIERLKWSLWHGQVDKALGKIDDLESAIAPFSETYARFPKLVKALSGHWFRLLQINEGSAFKQLFVSRISAGGRSPLPTLLKLRQALDGS